MHRSSNRGICRCLHMDLNGDLHWCYSRSFHRSLYIWLGGMLWWLQLDYDKELVIPYNKYTFELHKDISLVFTRLNELLKADVCHFGVLKAIFAFSRYPQGHFGLLWAISKPIWPSQSIFSQLKAFLAISKPFWSSPSHVGFFQAILVFSKSF